MHSFEKYGFALTEDELNNLVLASALVMMGLEDGRQDEPDNEELVFVARDLIATYVSSKFEVELPLAEELASDFVVEVFERGALK